MRNFKIIFLCLLALFCGTVASAGRDDLLPPDQAFKLSTQTLTPDRIRLDWTIADGYYLYRDKFKIESKTPAVRLGNINFPQGEAKHDALFGDTVIYRHHLLIDVPLLDPASANYRLQLAVRYQGCADIGICYPPQSALLNIELPTASIGPLKQMLQGIHDWKANLFTDDELLPPDQAFQFSAAAKDGNTLHVDWAIADGYYLYREKIWLEISDPDTVKLGAVELPHGTPKQDEAFGRVEIFHHSLNFDVPLVRSDRLAQTITVTAKFQGCAERGVCYPPMKKTVELALPAAVTVNSAPPSSRPQSEQDRIAQSLHQDTLWLTLASFFGFGVLLSFTPCIFPMIPILSGIIVGHGKTVTTARAFLLSLSYVLASAVTYTVFGVLAAMFGSNLQTGFQQPWIIASFSVVLVLLSLSMFGFYNLELPKSLQARLHNSSEKHRDGSLWGAAIMGSLSSLIVGPCVAAPLAGALIYIGRTGDALLGGSALFVMGLGMGLPLLLMGTSAGKLLPKAGHWLNATKAFFGVLMLAMAVWMLERILPGAVILFLWALLLIIPAIYLNALDPLPASASGWRKLWKGTGIVMLTYGILLLIGSSIGNNNPLRPLQGIGIDAADAAAPKISFTRVHSVQELETYLDQADAADQRIMLDFYADWCISCKEMETYTLNDDRVRRQLADFMLLQADVTENSPDDQALLKKFDLIGPPAILFFGTDRREKQALRVIGYQDSATFLNTLQHVTQ